jgi:hypothetical protein
LGDLKLFLGLNVQRNRTARTITISQGDYVHKILGKFEMRECKGSRTPMEVGLKLFPGENDFDTHTYQVAIGSIMYLATMTRADIAYPIGTLAMFASNPSRTHWQAVQRLMRYLKHTQDYGLCLGGGEEKLEGFTDSSFADIFDGRSTGGYIFKIGNGVVSWSSKRQPLVTLSSTEAEYVQATEASKEAIWLKSLLKDFSCTTGPIELFGDNRSAIALSTNTEFHARTKHINVKHHFIREAIENESVVFKWVATEDNIADVTTKALPLVKHEPLVAKLGLSSTSTN